MKSLHLLLFIVVYTTVSLSYAQSVKFEKSDFFTALQKAQTENKYLFVEYGVYCGYCQLMKKEVFIQPEVGKFYNQNFINIVLDETSSIGIDMGERFHIYLYPTFLFFNPKGELVHLIGSYRKPDEIIEEGKKALYAPYSVPNGVWWNQLKTQDEKVYSLFNLANQAYQKLNAPSLDYTQMQDLNLKDFTVTHPQELSSALSLIEQSLAIEHYYFNVFTGTIIHYLAGNRVQALALAKEGLNNFPHHTNKSRYSRDQVLYEVIKKLE
ncbi:DUF255 domain-containing protein [Rapidithrix thailandica]|uniref:DUF255 domain-containing protein n=1 Tax=Rapidithrix thailandica TaxID=413964 RepID=A0AAW9S8U6_9BACT